MPTFVHFKSLGQPIAVNAEKVIFVRASAGGDHSLIYFSDISTNLPQRVDLPYDDVVHALATAQN